MNLKGINHAKTKNTKGAAKRFRLTATGKIKRGHSHARHILTKKTNKRKRIWISTRWSRSRITSA